jgi:hypothetical protein
VGLFTGRIETSAMEGIGFTPGPLPDVRWHL